MSGRYVGHYIIVDRRDRAKPAIATVRRTSRAFREAYLTGDSPRMIKESEAGLNALVVVFETLRNAEDEGRILGGEMARNTALLIDGLSSAEQHAIYSAARLNRTHQALTALSLREALNKVAHYQELASTFRIDGRGAHYLVLCGRRGRRLWAAEILVSRLCNNAALAARAIR